MVGLNMNRLVQDERFGMILLLKAINYLYAVAVGELLITNTSSYRYEFTK